MIRDTYLAVFADNVLFSVFVFGLVGLLVIVMINIHLIVRYIKNLYLHKKLIISDNEATELKTAFSYLIGGALLTLSSRYFTTILFVLLSKTLFANMDVVSDSISVFSGYGSFFLFLIFLLAGISIEVSGGIRWMIFIAKLLYTIGVLGAIVLGFCGYFLP